MSSLEEIRRSLERIKDSKTSEAEIVKRFGGKLSLSKEMLANFLFSSLPDFIKMRMYSVQGLCLAGGYIRDKLNGTKFGDYDFWIFGATNFERTKRFSQVREEFVKYMNYVGETKNTHTYNYEGNSVQLMKRLAVSPYGVIKDFDFYCCKFALYLGDKGIPKIEETNFSREHALSKIMVPIDNLEDTHTIASVIRHISKLHRKGYAIEDKYLYDILYKYEQSKSEDY